MGPQFPRAEKSLVIEDTSKQKTLLPTEPQGADSYSAMDAIAQSRFICSHRILTTDIIFRPSVS